VLLNSTSHVILKPSSQVLKLELQFPHQVPEERLVTERPIDDVFFAGPAPCPCCEIVVLAAW
jgi:hypothetical protein